MTQRVHARNPTGASLGCHAPSGAPLKIGPQNDALEREADQMADEVMSGAGPGAGWSFSRVGVTSPLQRKCSCETGSEELQEGNALQRKTAAGMAETGQAPGIVHDVLGTSGAPLDSSTRGYFERGFGYDFSRVRLHTDSRAAESAAAVNALAYTVGHHIVFGNDHFDPASPAGRKLLAHELVHVAQQQGGKGPLVQRQAAPDGPHQAELPGTQECENRADITQEFKDFVTALPGLLQSAQDFTPQQRTSFKNEFDRLLQPEGGVNVRSFKVISCDKINSDLMVGQESAAAQVDPNRKEIRLSKRIAGLMDGFRQNKDKVSLGELIETLAHEKRHVTLGSALKADPKAVLPGRSDTAADKAEYRAQEILAVAEEIAVGRMAFGKSYAVDDSKQEKLRRQSNMIRNYVTEAEYNRLRSIIIAKLRERYGFAHGCDNALTLGVVSSMDHNRWFQCVSGAPGGIVPPVPADLHICEDFCKTQGHESGPTENEENKPIQRKCADCAEEEQLRRGATGGGSSALAAAPPSVGQALRSPGRPLDPATRAYFEPRFGYDFGSVRVHTDGQAAESARDIGALAYTAGNDVVFDSNRYSPFSNEGRKLLAHELTHVVQQGNGGGPPARSPRAVRRKVILKHAEMKDKERRDFLAAHAHEWGRNKHLASQIMEEMAAAGDPFDFEDSEELRTEIVKRIATVVHMKGSQDEVGKVPGHLQKSFGYPFNPGTDLYGPRVNFAARDYWTPGVADNYARRTDKAKNEHAMSKSRAERHTVYGDQPMGSYLWKLTEKGKKDPYSAIKLLFAPQAEVRKRSLFHCDYLISVVNFMSLADAIGKDEFNKRIAAYGVDKIVLNWNLFEDLHSVTALRDKAGKFTSTTTVGLKSTQRVKPSTEHDLVVGDHVVFSNHLAYDPLNTGSGHPWKLENAVFIGPHGGKKGNENVYLGHGSGRLTGGEMKHKLAAAFNTVVGLTDPWIANAKSHNKKVAAKAQSTLATKFNVHRVGKEFHVQGKDGLGCNQDVDFKVRQIGDNEVPGLRNPCNPGEMFPVERPIESAPGKATP